MASPVAESMQNGISTPPATATAPNPSPQPQSTSQPSQPSQPSQHLSSNGATTAAAPAANMNAPFSATSLQDAGNSKRPRDARLIHLVLANMGVSAYTERVPLQLLDLAYRYTSGILTDALSYEPPATVVAPGKLGKRAAEKAEEESGGVGLNALRTAVGARAASQFAGVLGKEFMAEVASERNRIALPRVEREFGVRLPPERYCFTGVGWGVRGSWEDEVESSDEEMGDGEDGGDGVGAGFGGPVGGETNGAVGDDTAMGGMEDEEADEEEFEEAMGIRPEAGAAE